MERKNKSLERKEAAFPHVCVLGGDHPNTLGTIRCLGEAGIPFFLVVLESRSKSFVSQSRWVKNFCIIKTESEVCAALEPIVRLCGEYKPMVICCHDGLADFVDRDDWVWRHFRVPNAGGKLGGLSRYMDKELVGRIAEQAGFSVPKTWEIELPLSSEDRKFIFPCILKPVKSVEGTKHDFCICRNDQELNIALTKLSSAGKKRILLQEFLDLRGESLLLGVRTQEGKTILSDKVKKITRGTRTFNLGLTSFCRTGGLLDNSLRQSAEFLVEAIDYYGIFSIEFLETNKGSIFCEINLRTDTNIYFVSASGVNLPAIWCGVVNLAKEKRSLLCMQEFSHIKNCFNKRKFFRLLLDFARTDVFAIFSIHDLKPFFSKIFLALFYYPFVGLLKK